MVVQVFGVVCSPAICPYVFRQTANDSAEDPDLVLKWVTSTWTTDSSLILSSKKPFKCRGLWRGAFEEEDLDWLSSHPAVLKEILSKEVETLLLLNLDMDSPSIERTLVTCMVWDYKVDKLILKVSVPEDIWHPYVSALKFSCNKYGDHPPDGTKRLTRSWRLNG